MLQYFKYFFLISLFLLIHPSLVSGQDISKYSFLFDAQSIDGSHYTLSQNDKKVSRAFVFLSTTCPIANSYITELNRIAKVLPDGAELYGVIAEAGTTRREAAKHFFDYGATFPILFDASQLLRSTLRPTHVPEAFVLNAAGEVVYRGAIDNAYESIGRRRVNVENHYLEEALAAVAVGRKPVVSQTTPVGCVLGPERTNPPIAAVTYARNIAPIIQQRCQNCHRPGQVAPFALTNYNEAKSERQGWACWGDRVALRAGSLRSTDLFRRKT